jgi:hypothetical protein
LAVDHRGRVRDVEATFLRPERHDLREDPLAELVAGARECEGSVRVQALELLRVARAADAEVERRSVVGAALAARELRASLSLLGRRPDKALRERGVSPGGFRPALDSAGRF